MAWLSSYGADNLITDETASRIQTTWGSAGGTWVKYTRTDTESRYRYTSMTAAAAATCVTELLAATPAGTTRTAIAKRQNDADAYYVDVSDQVTGTWAAA